MYSGFCFSDWTDWTDYIPNYYLNYQSFGKSRCLFLSENSVTFPWKPLLSTNCYQVSFMHFLVLSTMKLYPKAMAHGVWRSLVLTVQVRYPVCDLPPLWMVAMDKWKSLANGNSWSAVQRYYRLRFQALVVPWKFTESISWFANGEWRTKLVRQ